MQLKSDVEDIMELSDKRTDLLDKANTASHAG